MASLIAQSHRLIDRFLLYFNTVRFLRFRQITARLILPLRRIRLEKAGTIKLQPVHGAWQPTTIHESRMTSASEFCFLNKIGSARSPSDWNHPKCEKLWLYNLHYFEDLVAKNSDVRAQWHRELVDRWILENPVAQGNGWEPYPLSLRIVNWIKWFLSGNRPGQHWLVSLAQQASVLNQSLEYHLMGNHLFANGKALVFAGLFFEGKESDVWLKRGLLILDCEIREQILSDGGNFELSPMYHNIMLCDILDLINIANTYNNSEVAERVEIWRRSAERMLGWMQLMLHQDNELSFFNDTAIGVAPEPSEVMNYATSLGVQPVLAASVQQYRFGDVFVHNLMNSGYVRVAGRNSVALLDCANIGPDYLPGHAHADNLSFELSLYNQRVFVNSGTSCYGTDSERHRQRSTASHNTVEIDCQNSSEVWGGFRVARRARSTNAVVRTGTRLSVACSHDGFRRLGGGVIHQRNWEFSDNQMHIADQLHGRFSIAKAYFYLHPEVNVSAGPSEHSYIASLKAGQVVKIQFSGAHIVDQISSTWHPEFGMSISNSCLVATLSENVLDVLLEW